METTGQEQGKQAEGVTQAVCFKLAHEEYGLDIRYVQEVVRLSDITPVPQMPDCCRGVINIRSNVVALFDLRTVLKLPEKPFDDKMKVIVAIHEEKIVGFLVDEMLDNIKLSATDIEPGPAVKMNIDKECIIGLAKLAGRMVVLIDVPKIYAGLERASSTERIQS